MSRDNWRELAEKATKEQDPEKLMALIEELIWSPVAARSDCPATQKLESLIGRQRDSIVQNYVQQ